MKQTCILPSIAVFAFFNVFSFSFYFVNTLIAQTVAIDAGHCAQTQGKRSAPFTQSIRHANKDFVVNVEKGEQYREHYANVGVAYYLNYFLSANGFKCVKAAWDDKNGRDDEQELSLSGRHAVIRQGKADISISCHFNAFGTGESFNSAEGIEVFVWNADEPNKSRDSKRLANLVQSQIVSVGKQKNRGVKESHFALVDCSRTYCQASILIEFAFMTNEKEATELFCNPNVWRQYARAVAQAVCEYYGKPFLEPR